MSSGLTGTRLRSRWDAPLIVATPAAADGACGSARSTIFIRIAGTDGSPGELASNPGYVPQPGFDGAGEPQ